ncbi:hypothetical protein R3P38DRAFT_3274519 [Favolaschia claudopus]|uniref:Uncharacterized protein n=1 Tax=Favolaschia claudopus TaxID=2862362 RepID=A0AAW0AZP0_9AGAR
MSRNHLPLIKVPNGPLSRRANGPGPGPRPTRNTARDSPALPPSTPVRDVSLGPSSKRQRIELNTPLDTAKPQFLDPFSSSAPIQPDPMSNLQLSLDIRSNYSQQDLSQSSRRDAPFSCSSPSSASSLLLGSAAFSSPSFSQDALYVPGLFPSRASQQPGPLHDYGTSSTPGLFPAAPTENDIVRRVQQPRDFATPTTRSSSDHDSHSVPPSRIRNATPITVPPSQSNLPLPPTRIPKVVTDKIQDHATRILALEQQIQNDADIIRQLQTTHSELEASQNDLDNENRQLSQRLSCLEDTVELQNQTIDRLFSLVEANGSAAPPTEDDTTKAKIRDNTFNTAVRKTMLVAMGLPRTAKAKDACKIRSQQAGGGYVKDGETGGRLLRPDWNATFTENSAWHTRMITYVRQQVPQHTPAINAAAMKAKSDDDILERLETIFRNIATEFRKLQRAGNAEAESDNEAAVQDDDNSKQIKRRQGRKQRACNSPLKAEERGEVLRDAKVDLGAAWEFLTIPAYQSTDESDQSDVLDPETETESTREVPVASTRKPWKTRTPKYRSNEVQDEFNELEKMVLRHRVQWEKNNKGKTAAHPRVAGGWRDGPLPFRKPNKVKIPRWAIDEEWLASHQDQDTPSRIESGDVVDAEADADDEAP